MDDRIARGGLLRIEDVIGRPGITPEQAEENRRAGRRGVIPRPEIKPLIPVATSTWWKWVKEGRCPKPVKIGGSVFWRASEIHEFIESQREEIS